MRLPAWKMDSPSITYMHRWDLTVVVSLPHFTHISHFLYSPRYGSNAKYADVGLHNNRTVKFTISCHFDVTSVITTCFLCCHTWYYAGYSKFAPGVQQMRVTWITLFAQSQKLKAFNRLHQLHKIQSKFNTKITVQELVRYHGYPHPPCIVDPG